MSCCRNCGNCGNKDCDKIDDAVKSPCEDDKCLIKGVVDDGVESTVKPNKLN